MIFTTLRTMKKMKMSFFKFVLVLIAFTLNYSAKAADYYWINGSGSWNNNNHWSLTSGGISAGSIPTQNDHVHFDENSFPSGYGDVILTENTEIKSISISSQTPLNLTGLYDLVIHGEFTATTAYNIYVNTIIFENNSSLTNDLDFNDISVSADLKFTAGNWSLKSKMITSWQNEIRFEKGQFESNGHPINSNKIIANQSSYKFNLTNSAKRIPLE